MRYPVYSQNTLPGVDAPLCRKSKSYVSDLIAQGHTALDSGGVLLRGRIGFEFDRTLKNSAMTDWFTSQVSLLPKGRILVISTRQLAT